LNLVAMWQPYRASYHVERMPPYIAMSGVLIEMHEQVE
jgi:hypothetical protein